MSLAAGGPVIVVGAGLAGLAAAHRLTTAGFAVTVLEARERAGGKHARESLGGIEYEPWPGWLPRSAPAFAELVAELGLAGRVERAPVEQVASLRDGRLRSVSLALRAVMRGSVFSPFRMRRLALLASWLGGALDPDAPWRDTRLDDRSAADFCQVYLGRRAHEELVAPLFAGAFGVDSREVSRQLLFALLGGAGDIGVDALAGAGVLAEALAARLGDLRPKQRVEAVDRDLRGVRLASGETLRGTAVVLAVSSREAARLVGSVEPRSDAAFAALRTESALVLAVSTHRDVGLALRELWIPAREGGELASISVRRPRLLQLVARADLAARHGHRLDAELSHFLLEAAERALPGLTGEITETRLHRFPNGRPAFAVGHYRARAKLPLACAGDWCVAPHVEGELASGLSAARAIGSH